MTIVCHDILLLPIHDVLNWKHFLRYWPFVRGIDRSPVNSQHKGQWHGALIFYFICAWIFSTNGCLHIIRLTNKWILIVKMQLSKDCLISLGQYTYPVTIYISKWVKLFASYYLSTYRPRFDILFDLRLNIFYQWLSAYNTSYQQMDSHCKNATI